MSEPKKNEVEEENEEENLTLEEEEDDENDEDVDAGPTMRDLMSGKYVSEVFSGLPHRRQSYKY